jgi:hypothetical protein
VAPQLVVSQVVLCSTELVKLVSQCLCMGSADMAAGSAPILACNVNTMHPFSSNIV